MNKQGENGIEYVDYTWNPATGCEHGCPYCFARQTAERFYTQWDEPFKPRFHEKRLREPFAVRHPCVIFVVDMGDLFGHWVPWEWQERVFNVVRDCHWHTFLFLTKNPRGMLSAAKNYYNKLADGIRFDESLAPDFFNRTWWGTSTTGEREELVSRLWYLRQVPSENLFISAEPLLNSPGEISLDFIKQVIIGEQTKPTVEVNRQGYYDLYDAAKQSGAKFFVKQPLASKIPVFIQLECLENVRELAWADKMHKKVR